MLDGLLTLPSKGLDGMVTQVKQESRRKQFSEQLAFASGVIFLLYLMLSPDTFAGFLVRHAHLSGGHRPVVTLWS